MAFIRQYAMAGDPLGRLASKRKQASIGPRLKAARKAQVRERRQLRFMGDPFGGMTGGAFASTMGKAMGAGGGPGAFFSQLGAGLKNFLKGPGASVLKGAAGALLGPTAPAGLPPGFNARSFAAAAGLPGATGGFGGKRRSINPTNVKALRRGLRRVEGFRKLVKRVDKLLPVGARSHPPVARARGKRR